MLLVAKNEGVELISSSQLKSYGALFFGDTINPCLIFVFLGPDKQYKRASSPGLTSAGMFVVTYIFLSIVLFFFGYKQYDSLIPSKNFCGIVCRACLSHHLILIFINQKNNNIILTL